MTLRIRMLLYSGKVDPEWTIDGAEEQEFRRLRESPAFDTARPPAPWRLGYRGFVIIDPDITPSQPLAFTNAPEVERFLLRTGPADELPFAADSPFFPPPLPVEPAAPLRVGRAIAPSRAADALPWNPADPQWFGANAPLSNCYGYATNRFMGGDPGRGSGNPWPLRLGGAGSQIMSGMLSDGLRRSIRFPKDQDLAAGEGYYIAAVSSPGVGDMHYYREDKAGGWSHKNGGSEPSLLDDTGRPISDPRFCNRGSMSVFIGFMIVPPSAVTA